MNWKNIYNNMDERERLEMLRLLLKRVGHPRRVLLPVHLLFPAMLAQFMVLLFSKSLVQLAVGNIVIAGAAMLPSTFKRPVKYHWLER